MGRGSLRCYPWGCPCDHPWGRPCCGRKGEGALQEAAAAVPSPWCLGSVTTSAHDAGAAGQAGTIPWPVGPRDPLDPVLLWQTDPLLSAGKKPHPWFLHRLRSRMFSQLSSKHTALGLDKSKKVIPLQGLSLEGRGGQSGAPTELPCCRCPLWGSPGHPGTAGAVLGGGNGNRHSKQGR